MKIKLLYLLCWFIYISIPAKAQINSDSLWAIWGDDTQPLEDRMQALHAIDTDENGMSRKANPDSSLYRAQLMYDLAEENGNKKWKGKALLSIGNYHNTKGSFEEAIKFYTQGKEIGETTMNKKLIGGGTFNLGLIHMKKGEADEAIKYFLESIKNFGEIGDQFKQSAAMDRTAMIYQFMKSDPKKALTYLELSLKIKEELIKTNDNPKARFVLNGIKQTIKSVKESLKEVEDTINLDSYNSTELNKDNLVQHNTKTNASPPAMPPEEGEEDSPYKYLLKSLKDHKQNGNNQSVAELLQKIGIYLEIKNQLDSALHYYLKSVEISEKTGDKFARGLSLGNVGRVYSLKGDMVKGLDALNKGRQIFKEIGNLSEDANLKNVIGNIYLRQKEYPEALEIFFENLDYHKREGQRKREAGTLSNIGNVFIGQGKTEEAKKNYNAALKIFEEINYSHGVAGVLLELGNINFGKGLYDEALKNKARGLTISEKIRYNEGILLAQIGIANIYTAQNKHTKSLSYATRALELAQNAGNIAHIQNSSATLSKSYKAKGKYKQALEMKELQFQMRDSIQSQENQKAVIQLKVEADYEKQKALDDLENEKRVAVETQKKENQQKLSIAIAIGLLLISILAFLIFNRLKITRKQKEIIEEQKKKVEQSEKYKEQFLANMSHEIRTPMHAISGMVKILKRNEHLPQQDAFLNAMHTSSDNLVVILNDVLDLSKIEAGKLDIECIPISPSAVIENVVQILQFKAEEKGLELNYHIDEEVPSLIMGDPSRLNQVLINLVGNGIKFTEKGNIDIVLSKENNLLRFSIKDSGIGIPKEKLDQVFGAFMQVSESTSRHYGGTGLGLSISKQLVELQNGTISLESEEGEGSTFYVDLPIVTAAKDASSESLITKERLQSMASALKGTRILLAEDNAFNQMIAQDDLSYLIEDVHIDVVENGALAIEKYKTGNYDLILMDVQMPILNGFEATQQIRNIEKSKDLKASIPIIAMTASLLKSEVDNCYEAGMDNYIPKPYKTEELIGPIYDALKANQN